MRDLFFRALQFGPGDREQFLSGSAPSAEIRDQVLALLRYDAGGETFLTQAIALSVLCASGWTFRRL